MRASIASVMPFAGIFVHQGVQSVRHSYLNPRFLATSYYGNYPGRKAMLLCCIVDDMGAAAWTRSASTPAT